MTAARRRRNDGKTVYRLTVPANVPVDGFWSVSAYNDKGFFEKNPQGAYSVNNITAAKNADGSVAIQFGGCDGKIPNCPADHAGLELRRANVSAAGGHSRRQVEVPRGASRELEASAPEDTRGGEIRRRADRRPPPSAPPSAPRSCGSPRRHRRG